MAIQILTRGLYKFRFLIVAALAVSLLSTPLLSQADEKKMSELKIVEVNDSIAGLSTDVSLGNLKKSSYIELLLTQPNGHEITIDALSKGEATMDVVIPAQYLYRAGRYSIEVREVGKNEDFSSKHYFKILASNVSETESKVSSNKKVVAPGKTIETQVTLTDKYGNPIDGHVLKAASSKPYVKVYSSDYATDEKGQMTFFSTSTHETEVDVQFMDTSTKKILEKVASLEFTANENDARGGNDKVILASGDIEYFEIEDLDTEVIVGDELTFTVTALDADSIPVSDYVGTVSFTSTDTQAEVPNDYTFTNQDLGEHTFSLGVKFITPGIQTLYVNDADNFFVQGEFEVEVLENPDSDVDLGDDFVTDDFDREGDFTLLAPASGSYSNDTVEIQGEADFGYHAVIYLNDEEEGRSEVNFDNEFTYLLDDLDDGTYELYVDIVELDEGDVETADIIQVIETSDVETIKIDTEAPDLISIKANPDSNLESGDIVTITVLSEKGMLNSSVIFEDEVYALEETRTDGKYEVEILMPDSEGSYPVDVLLMDSLGNEVQYRDQLTLDVDGDSSVQNPDDDDDDVPTPSIDLGAPTGVVAIPGEEKIQLSWETPSNAEAVSHYRIYYGPSTDALFAQVNTTDAATSWTVPELIGGQAHYFSVAAVNSAAREGLRSTPVLGIPLAKNIGGEIPLPDNPTPPINDVPGMPSEQPTTGAPLLPIGLMSIFGSLGYGAFRRKRA